jgi:phage tail sheath protein FI
LDHDSAGDIDAAYGTTAWGGASTGTFNAKGVIVTASLTGGNSGSASTPGNIQVGMDEFKNTEEVDVTLLMTGDASAATQIYAINNIAEYRRDCLAFISPPSAAVVNNAGQELTDVRAHRDKMPSSSYAVMDSGWKYMYDKYNDVYRYVPLNGDIAGCCAFTDNTRDPFWSPAGAVRGNIRNAIKLPFNPNKTQRDGLYKKGINPVVGMPGQGIILFGDKTLLAKPSAFDRINVRRLFILLEKSIANMAKSFLFEFNDAFTRSRFVSTVEPFLINVQGRQGIQDFSVVCDDSNNTPEVVDRNEFRGDIYVKPSRSINFIQLQFVAVRSGVEFSEITGG